jgi:hypothetical protein
MKHFLPRQFVNGKQQVFLVSPQFSPHETSSGPSRRNLGRLVSALPEVNVD